MVYTSRALPGVKAPKANGWFLGSSASDVLGRLMCRQTEGAMSQHLGSKALILFLFLPWANLVHAQVRTSGQVSGTVVDPSGAAVVGATITLSRPATGFAQALTSDEFGGYIFPV